MSRSLAPSRGPFPGASKTSFQIVFQKGPGAKEPRAKGMGVADAELAARRIEGCLKMRRTSIKVRSEKFTPAKNLSPIFPSSRAAKAEFSAVVRDSSTGVLAKITDSSKDTVKCWRARRSFPGGENLMQLAAEGGDEAVREWVALKCGFISPEMAEAAYASAYQVQHQSNPAADAVKGSIQRTARRRTALLATIMAARQGLSDLDGGE